MLLWHPGLSEFQERWYLSAYGDQPLHSCIKQKTRCEMNSLSAHELISFPSHQSPICLTLPRFLLMAQLEKLTSVIKSVDCSHFSQARGSDYEGRNVGESCRDCLAGLSKSQFSWAIVSSTNWLSWCVQLWTLQEHNMVCKKCICQCKCQRESTKANG